MAIETDRTMYDCPLCYRPLKPPVLKCRAGHGACGSCAKNHSRKCHLCADGGEYEHVHWLDPYVMAAKVRCPNEPFGCRTLVTYFLVEDHRLECPHAPCYCPEPGCTFPGSPPMLYDHLKVHHDWLVTSIAFGKKLDLEIDEAQRRHLLATKNGEHLFLLVITEVVGGGREVRLVRVCGKDAGPSGYWCKVWTHAPMDPGNGYRKPVLMLEDRARSCAVPSEEAAMEVGGRYLSVQLLDMHPRGGFALRLRITRLLLDSVNALVADEGRQDGQAAFVSAGEGSQEATESGNVSLAATSPSVMEKAPLDIAESQNCPSPPTSVPLASLTSITPKVLSSEVGDPKHDVFVLAGEGRQDVQTAFVSVGEGSQEATESVNALVATALLSVMEKVPLDTAESKSCPISPTSAPLPSPGSTTLKALTSEDGDTQLVATISPLGMEKAPPDTAESKNCRSSPASVPLPSLASTTPEALTSKHGDTKLVRAKHPKKNYHTSNPRRSARLRECFNNPVEELAADHRRSCMLDPAEESVASIDNA
ncbi:uncharacterized protein LOC124649456 [Lolium rigidum]|uniref:uncharacterized protein LOC124649456 n=1 Tax=Lolium rigidum TaxID=89674 RepID=UPI001F5C4BBC|nr:uncharacterized protein LOC124649456 [Lolium rigidum]